MTTQLQGEEFFEPKDRLTDGVRFISFDVDPITGRLFIAGSQGPIRARVGDDGRLFQSDDSGLASGTISRLPGGRAGSVEGFLVADGAGYKLGTTTAAAFVVEDGSGGYVIDSSASDGDLRFRKVVTNYETAPPAVFTATPRIHIYKPRGLVSTGFGYLVNDGTGYEIARVGPGDVFIVDDGSGGYTLDSGVSAGDLVVARINGNYQLQPA